jgi:hypothetical protein
LEGDGTVLLKSLRVKSNAIEVKSLHTDLMGKALEQISKILNINYKGHFETEKIDNYLSIIVPKGVDLYEDVEDLKFSKVTIYDRFDWYLMFNVKKGITDSG